MIYSLTVLPKRTNSYASNNKEMEKQRGKKLSIERNEINKTNSIIEIR